MKLYFILLFTLGLFHNQLVMADDTEIYVATRDSSANPNVIFLMDTSGSMRSTAYLNGQATTRLAVVQDVAVDVITNTDNINIAIGRFNKNNEGGSLSSPLLPIDNTGVRDMVSTILNDYEAAGGTPITEALYEMAAYYRGDAVKWGATETDYTDLCMEWEEAETTSIGGVDYTEVDTAVSVLDSWWYVLIYYNDASLLKKTMNKKQTAWLDWNEIKWSRRATLSWYYGISEDRYRTATAASGTPWFASKIASQYWRNLFDLGAHTYRDWDNLTSQTRQKLDNGGVSKADYIAYTTESTLQPVDKNDEDLDEEYTCKEYLTLEPALDDGQNNYVSPIEDECQTNHIVVFTDGSPNQDSSATTVVRNLLSGLPEADFPTDDNFSRWCSGNGGCAEELSYALYHGDNSDSLDGDQPIYVHTIGGFISGDYTKRLENMATYGGGIYGEGSDADALKAALLKVFETITSTSGTFAAPAVTVNAFNNLEHLDQLYYSVFSPSTTASWQGNVKRYRIDPSGEIYDMNGALATDDTTGLFSENATSFWTLTEDAPDGKTVTKGGVARRLDDASVRKIYTDANTGAITSANNTVSKSNSNLKDLAAFDNLDDDEITDVLTWMSGYDPNSANGLSRRQMEDPLHSRPVLLTYGKKSNGDPDTTFFVGTNSGYLHAFDTDEDNPNERFGYIPSELFPSALAYYNGDTDKVYGLDGKITSFHDDENYDGIVSTSEDAYIYVGMRRGGRNYYALDVSNRDKPKLAFKIEGGSGDFQELGQTWSGMTPITIGWNGAARDVLVFGGGYDADEDNNNKRTAHSMGNAIYIVEPDTGKLIWKATKSGGNLNLSDMTSGIVGDIAPVDNDGDGLVDILYAADLGGRIWRIDLDSEASSAGSLAQGGMLADLGADGTQTNNVRFFTSPDVSYFSGEYYETQNSTGRYQLVIGSGYRAHPLDTATVDNIFIINDFDVDGAPTSYPEIKRSQLANLKNMSASSAKFQENGGYYQLTASGEKILSEAITLSGVSYLSSYQPSTTSARSGCEPDIGSSTVYAVSLSYSSGAAASINVSTSSSPGILDKPVVIYQQTEYLCEIKLLEDDDGNEVETKVCRINDDDTLGTQDNSEEWYSECEAGGECTVRHKLDCESSGTCFTETESTRSIIDGTSSIPEVVPTTGGASYDPVSRSSWREL